jgi:hypothetical protein
MLADSISIQSGGGWKFGNLSSQYLLSCSQVHFGCAVGASPEDVYRLSEVTNTGIPLESDLPYEREVTSCKLLKADAMRVRVQANSGVDLCVDPSILPFGFKWLLIRKNVLNMKRAILEYGPIAGTLQITNSLYAYRGGVYESKFGEGVLGGHAVLITGWCDDGPNRYWTIKNWYGPEWGENGYGRIRLGNNTSGIESRASAARVVIPDFLKEVVSSTDKMKSANFYY